MLAKSICKALSKKPIMRPLFFFAPAKKKTESESDQAFSPNYQEIQETEEPK